MNMEKVDANILNILDKPLDAYYTVGETAKILGVSAPTVRRLINKKIFTNVYKNTVMRVRPSLKKRREIWMVSEVDIKNAQLQEQ